ncbi:FadR/GntR family transcriptional regulator [Microbacterium sp. LWH3-1.2]|uniref:FadR/GntR family transcriptional regulator n=1 Tax=Microbacterium sp. LWH3-1.2 TaxID=3135256 RepID=UPI003422751D
MTTPEPNRSQTDVVIHGIKAMIVDGSLSAGSRLPIEKELAAALGVSRGPLREGVRALVILGVLETRQGDGTYVTSLDPSVLMSSLAFLADLRDPSTSGQLLQVRRFLEVESAALAATCIDESGLSELEAILDRMDASTADLDAMDVEAFIDGDSEFHSRIAQATENPTLAAFIDSLVGRTMRIRIGRAVREGGSIAATQAEHRAIVDQLRAGSPDGARIRMAAHILGVEQFAVDHATDNPSSRGDAQ